MKKNAFLVGLLALAMVATGCANQSGAPAAEGTAPSASATAPEATGAATGDGVIDSADAFSNRDFEVGYDESTSALIQLNGNSAACGSNAVRTSGGTVTILDEGTYILSGTLNDGGIVVDTDKADKVQLVLNGVTIHSETSAAIYVRQSDKVFLTLAEGTENTLTNGGSFTITTGGGSVNGAKQTSEGWGGFRGGSGGMGGPGSTPASTDSTEDR